MCASVVQFFLPPNAPLPQDSIVRVCGRRTSVPVRVFGQGLYSEQGRMKIKGRSHKQEHAGTQT